MNRAIALVALSAMLLLASTAFAAPSMMGASGLSTSTDTATVSMPSMGSIATNNTGFGQMGAAGTMSGFGQTSSTVTTDSQNWFESMMPWLF